MGYKLYILNKRTGEYQVKGGYKTKQAAEAKAKPYMDKGRKVKIIALPERDELDIGFKIHLSNGELYGEIIDKDNSFWFVKRAFKDEDDSVFFLKDSFLDKYENGTFIIKEES